MSIENAFHKALANDIRREILLHLEKGPRYLSDISKKVGRKPQTVDFHLNLLGRAGLVEGEWREGKKYYTLQKKEILDFLRKGKPMPPSEPKDLHTRLEKIESKLEQLLKKGEADHLF